jgi:hypothetical protein
MATGIDLYWLPLGAGGRSVRLNGRAYEWLVARLEGRPARDLYHSALRVGLPEGHVVIEMAPAWGGHDAARGVVAEGAVGSRCARRLRLFRYEIRRWAGGAIPDVEEAVESPRHLTDDEAVARRLLDLVPQVPTLVWGRDELRTGDMWNSNSLVSWLLVRAGLDVERIAPPAGGRAPGWKAGLVVARLEPSTRLPGAGAGRRTGHVNCFEEGGRACTCRYVRETRIHWRSSSAGSASASEPPNSPHRDCCAVSSGPARAVRHRG